MRIVQLYEVARTAHLERVEGADEIVILYREKRYDFDEQAAQKVAALRRGKMGSVVYAFAHDVDVVEINEPLVARAALRSILFIIAARLRARLLRRTRPKVVAYAIANMPPADLASRLPVRAAIRYRVHRLFVPAVWHLLDRIAYGTGEAAQLYAEEFASSAHTPEAALIEALPAPAVQGDPRPRDPAVIFLGDLSERKGFPDVVAAWQEVRLAVPEAILTIVGRGAGADDARALSDSDDRVEVQIEPPRDEIRRALAQAKVLVLPSRRRPLWKEQIGLPILEGLAAGCVIVTTTETGIAEWLAQHGHYVVDERAVDEQLAPAITAAVMSQLTPAEVIADLPDVDGREKARIWMYESTSSLPGTSKAPLPVRLFRHRRHAFAYLRGVLRGHPGVRIGSGVKLTGPGEYRLERGVTITSDVRMWVGAGAVLTMRRGSKIGDRSILNVESGVDILEGTRISWDVQVLDTDFHWLRGEDGTIGDHTRPISLGPRALIGARSTILKGVTVGEGAVVGAGSVVRRSVDPGAVVSGNPAAVVTRVTEWGSARS